MALYLFDLDDTLIEGYLGADQKQPYDRVVLLPNRAERIAQLRAHDHAIAVVTNQAGVAFGHITPEQFKQKIARVAQLLDLPALDVCVCFAHRDGKPPWNTPAEVTRRKPSPVMLYEAMGLYPQDAVERVLFIGDRPEDLLAARNAHVSFEYASYFFGTGLDWLFTR